MGGRFLLAPAGRIMLFRTLGNNAMASPADLAESRHAAARLQEPRAFEEAHPLRRQRAAAAMRDAEFAAWFGSSRIATPDGLPFMCYHATPRSFREFRVGEGGNGYNLGLGVYFAPTPQDAEHYLWGKPGAVHAVYLRAERPVTEEWLGKAMYGPEGAFYRHKARLLGFGSVEDAERDEDVCLDFDPGGTVDKEATRDAMDELRAEHGFDAVLGTLEILVFEPEQIRHAYDLGIEYSPDLDMDAEADDDACATAMRP